MSGARDRDPAGRARNARPRDGLGRPLSAGSAGEPTMPDDLALDDDATIALAEQLLQQRRPFHAHEVLEARWKACRDPAERAAWQGLAQLAVGLTHEARGNATGAERLIGRGRLNLAAGRPPAALDTAGVLGWAADWLAGRRGAALRLTGAVGGGP